MQAPFASLVAPEPVGASVRLRVLSLGAGVQSTTLALMATHGEIRPMPDCAIFADTGWEPPAVYRHLAWLMAPGVLAFPVHVVSAGNIRDDLLAEARGRRRASIPAYTRTAVPAGKERPLFPKPDDRIVGLRRSSDGEDSIGMIHRHCTADYKVVPIRRKVRELTGIAGWRSPSWPVAEQWIGISLDELVRIKPSMEDWQVNRWPLVERRMTRRDCLRWLERHGYPEPPKSACIGCPFHSDAAWRRLRDEEPEAWADAVLVDRAIRTGFRGIRGTLYLHRSAVPLELADLSDGADPGQLDLWPNECEGLCGV
ncbi:hypothetical protein J2847_005283 [Azospirillum agricola]|uniref:hypothetical protein n=1 Tax=Azospirillum agricola TaxID=1720247 RepID=UPI001AE329AE|nr:hypothetical protein [Azospirillum agricola]MBP2231960.1 hypothetical protein [Azospirillum agricola]